MPNRTTTVIKLSDFPPTLPVVPPNYPSGPAPGKIQLLLDYNSSYLYHKFSPYTNYHDSVLASVLSNRQPFIYTFIDDAQNSVFAKLPQSVQSLTDLVNINQDSINDVVRVSNFLISSWGVQFLVSQTAIQRLASFDETRVYNPLSPILSTIAPLTLGIGNMPTRHIEGGLLGLANSVTSVVGINLESGFQTPKSTVGNDALPTGNTGQGKGLIRGSDAAKGISSFQSKWAPSTTQNSSLLGSALNNFATSIKNSFTAFFGGAPQSPGIFRADEEGYKVMALGSMNLSQPWFASAIGQISQPVTQNKSVFGIIGSAAVTGNAQTVFIKQKLISLPDRFTYVTTTNGLTGYNINESDGVKSTGYSAGNKYTDVIGQQPLSSDTDRTNSDMLIQYSYYTQEANNYPSKFSDNSSTGVAEIEKELQKVIDNINIRAKATYNIFKNNASYLLPYGSDVNYIEYDSWSKKKGKVAFRAGAAGEYISGPSSNTDTTQPRTIDASVSLGHSLRMATTFLSDGINMLGVLPNDRSITGNSVYTGWTVWEPYDDDLIAFFFYDVVNDKYIPFRATVKAISEGNTAFWDELRFIGRADQLYSYNGFSRTLSFTFNVVINSVNELLPSWKKINYIASAVKPSNYTTGQVINNVYNRFIVPPMMMLTIGDLYKFQPIVITSLNVNIPDDASWETLNENNSKLGWSYLNGLITAPNLGKNYGQLPREAEIAVTCNILEKERAIMGGSHFGHEPRIDNWENKVIAERFLTGSVPYLPVPTVLHQNFVEWNDPGQPDPHQTA